MVCNSECLSSNKIYAIFSSINFILLLTGKSPARLRASYHYETRFRVGLGGLLLMQGGKGDYGELRDRLGLLFVDVVVVAFVVVVFNCCV